nr:hypothetical protein BHI3_32010 [Bacteriovorax sp. HI3]
MTFKPLLLSLTLMSALPAYSATKNLCDDMIASGKSSEESIKKCLAKLGESDTYKENQQKKKWQEEADAAKSSEEAARKANIESKKFTALELDEAGFGKAFYAIRVDYSNPRKPKEKRITEGDALCKYLGYEKSLKSIVSAEIMPQNANKNGLIVDTNFLGVVSKEPELYVDKDEKYTVRRYMEITCAKVKSKDVTGTAEELSKVTEDLIVLNQELNTPKKDETAGVNDGPRKPAGKTENGYKRPDWATQSPSQSVAK